MPKRLATLFCMLLAGACLPPAVADSSKYIAHDADIIAFRNIQLVDGTGSKAKPRQTVIIRDGRISAIGPAGKTVIPQQAEVIDGTGKTLLPGFVMMHEHLFYPTGLGNYTEMLHSFPRLYLAGGTTTMRTAGTMAPYADLNVRRAIEEDSIIGPDMDVTAPYLNGPGLGIYKVKSLNGPADTERMVRYWIGEGVSSYKTYMHIRQDELAQVIAIAHQHRQRVTGHLCSVTYREATLLGIDNLEHGFAVATDFVEDKQRDVCPPFSAVLASLANIDLQSPKVNSLISLLVENDVALTSTLTIFETFVPNQPKAYPEALAVLIPQLRKQYEDRWQSINDNPDDTWTRFFSNITAMERMFVAAGGKLLVGTDPTGYGGVIPGFSSKRAIELLVAAGFSFEQAIKIASLNGAKFLGKDSGIGTITLGKRADLVLVDGDPVTDTAVIRKIPAVFKKGVGYDTQAIIAEMDATVGLH